MAYHAGTTRYAPLVDFLRADTTDDVTLTLAEVAALVGGRLPDTAYVDSFWWRNAASVAVRQWETMGWRAHLNTKARSVTFSRIA